LGKWNPREQVKIGIALSDIFCKDNLQLIFKSTNNSPACVKSTSVEKLVERGWAKSFA